MPTQLAEQATNLSELDSYKIRFNKAMGDTVKGMVDAGAILLEIEQRPEIKDKFEQQCSLSQGTLSKLKSIATNIGDVQNKDKLPANWTTLYSLGRFFSAERIDDMANSGMITPETKQSDIKSLRGLNDAGSETDPEKSLVACLKKLHNSGYGLDRSLTLLI